MKTPIVALALGAILMTAGCGGGGGGGVRGSSPQQLPEPDGPCIPTADSDCLSQREPDGPCIPTADSSCLSQQEDARERNRIAQRHASEDAFRNQWGLSLIGADRAYAQLELEHGAGTEPGDGVTVGVIDWGLDTGHPVFAGKTVTEEFLGSAQDDDHYASLGTDVASVIAGRPSETFTAEETAANGVAWAADIAFFAVRAGKFRSMYSPTSFANVAGAWPQWLRHVIDWNSGGRTIDFVHLGIFYDGIIDQYDKQEIRSDFGAAIDALAQTGASEKTVFVLPGGDANGVPCDANEFEDNPELCVGGYVVASSVEVLPGLPALFPELLGHHVAVVAVGEDGNIAYFANRCGTAAPWCLAAPGANVRFAYAEPPDIRNTDVGDNSTYAAGMVTGGLALMKQFFRGQLSNTELVARLFATANKRGIYADSAVYGQGLLDLAAATSPVGNPRVARGEWVDGAGDHRGRDALRARRCAGRRADAGAGRTEHRNLRRLGRTVLVLARRLHQRLARPLGDRSAAPLHGDAAGRRHRRKAAHVRRTDG